MFLWSTQISKKAGYTKTIADNGLAEHETQRSSKNVHATQTNAALFTNMQQDHTLALANLATATKADRTLVALLTKTISELSSQVAHLTAKLATAQSENARIKKSGHQSTAAEHGHQASSNLTPPDPTSSQDQNVYSRSGQKFDPNGYFSSHGYNVEEAHTFATYRFPNNGHNKSATRLDIKGGKIWNKEWINGGPTE